MSPDRDARFTQEDPDDDFDEEEAPRSIFSATWFRVVLVLLGIGVVGAVAVPYVLDVVTPTHETTAASAPTTPTTTNAPASPAPSTPAPEGPKAIASTPAPKPAPPAMAAESAKSSPPALAAKKEPARETPKSEASDRMTAKSAVVEKAAPKKAPAAPGKGPDSGDYYVQVGAFKDQSMAASTATRLRQMNYSVVETTVRVGGGGAAPVAVLRPVPPAPAATPAPPAPRAAASAGPGPDRYDVIVSGGSPVDMNAKLTAKGLASEPAGDGVRIRPSLPLRDAVALSKDLGSEGFRVQVRRAGSTDPAPTPAPAPAVAPPPRPTASAADGDGQTLYRVRVGGFPDRAAAQTALRELQEKGYQPFIAKGRE